MEAEAYAAMASVEGRHWWFVGRRAVIDGLLDRIQLPNASRVLEAGCGSGGNIYMLQARGDVYAFDPHEDALGIARQRYPATRIEAGSLPDRLPFPEATFDLVAALDVLEHVEDDRAALASLVQAARPGGHVIVTVPAHQLLWGSHDRRLHHRRRYGATDLRALCAIPGCSIVYFGAFNTLLAPLALLVRMIDKVPGIDLGDQDRMPPGPLNAILSFVFATERWLVRRTRLPVGLSFAVILRRS